ncbi:MAG: HYR domain-containing protein [Bacteroidetes bacterium]|nr:MAG: HYR domain-containing protein [Bacteroidota bacterium]
MIRIAYLLSLGVCLAMGIQAQTSSFSSVQTTFFLQTNLERSYVLCPTGTGNLYVAGMKDFDLVLMEVSTEGDILDARYIDAGFGGLDVISELILDSDGKLLFCGNLKEDVPDGGFVFRYDPDAKDVLWAKTFIGNATLLHGLVEMGPGGDFLVYANPHFTGGDNAEIFRLNRSTGNMIPGTAWQYDLGTSENFSAMVWDDDKLYAVGRFTDGQGSIALKDMRQVLLRLDPLTGQPKWTRMSHINPGENARLYGRDLIIDQNSIISVYSGNATGVDLNASTVFLQKSNLDGEMDWVRKIEFQDWNAVSAEELIEVPDGYVVLCRTILADEGVVLLVKTDKGGNLKWARKVEHDFKSRIISTAQHQLLALGNYLYLTGSTENSSGDSRMFLIKANQSGIVSDSCAAFLPTTALVSNVADPQQYSVSPLVDTSWTQVIDYPVAPPVHFMPQRDFICQQPDAGNCQDLPDWTFKIDSIRCDDGDLKLYYTLCNIGGAAGTDSVPVTFYRGNPTESARPVLGTYLFDGSLAPGACASDVLTGIADAWFPSGVFGLVSVFAITNDDATWPSPFSLDTFPPTGIEECDYTNNLSFNFLLLNSPFVDLGPDQIICEDSSVTFDPGAGYISYLWQDGSTGQTFTADVPGTYWVEVTDICGFKQRDSVFFSFSLLPDTQFPDTTICPGESVTFSAPGFNFYSWAPATGLSCADCPTVTISPAATTTYTLFASDSLGCTLADTFIVQVTTGPSSLAIQCPANLTVQALPGAGFAVVDFNDPMVTTDCICGVTGFDLYQGQPSGSDFPIGDTQICFEAGDGCNTTATCCFTITVQEMPDDLPCDVKETPCIRYEILGITQNPAGEKTYRMRVVNKCSDELLYLAYQLPAGITAVAPADNSIYNSPGGQSYIVRNPNSTPFHSIRFKTSGAGIANGAADIFEYTLPPQANPTFIRVIARLAFQQYYEAHLNVFACMVEQVSNRPGVSQDRTSEVILASGLQVIPNPVSDMLQIRIPQPEIPTPARILIQDQFGRVLVEEKIAVGTPVYTLSVPASWPNGVYQVIYRTDTGITEAGRFVVAR